MADDRRQRALQRKRRMNAAIGRFLARYIRFVGRTSKAAYIPTDMPERLYDEHPCIVAFWHGQFLLTPLLKRPQVRVCAMVARHGDAELIGGALERLGVELVRGAGAGGRARDRGGAAALRGCVRALADGVSVTITADVPPGPARRASPGIITLARMSGRPIIPIAVATSRYKAFNTWSRMTLNLPFSKLAFVQGEAVRVPRDADADEQERLRVVLEDELNRITDLAYRTAGADPARATPLPRASRGGGDAPADPGIWLKVYRSATRLVGPAAPALIGWRRRQGKEDATRHKERYGIAARARPEGGLVWVHAASVGEANAIMPVIEAMMAVMEGLKILLTTGTTTSARLVEMRLGSRVIHQYVPLDTPRFMRQFLAHWRPDLVVLTESEIWPNLVLEVSARRIPLVLANARISSRSFNRWRKARGVSQPIFGRFDLILAQNESLARRFTELGAPNVVVAGSLKIDAPPPPVDEGVLVALRSALNGRPLLVAASTHEGEEEVVAKAHRLIARHQPGLCTIIAPRHPERGPGIAEHLQSLGLSVSQRSLGALPAPTDEIYLADTIGELGTLYALGAVAFIGGSLASKGGQNPIEAVRHGTAVLAGPQTENFADLYQALVRGHGAIEVHDAEELAASVLRLMNEPLELERLRNSATAVVDGLSGALARSMDALLAYLPGDEGLKRAS